MRNESQYTEKEHFVPQFYLRYFLNSNQRIVTTDIQTGKTFDATPKRQCFENDQYELKHNREYVEHNTVENAISQYEGWLNTNLSSIIERCSLIPEPFSLTADDDVSLAFFLALQILRQPETKKMANDLYSKVPQLSEIDKNFLYIVNSLYRQQKYIDNVLSTLKNVINPYTKFFIAEDRSFFETLASYVLSNCTFSVAIPKNKDKYFITCDNPIVKNTPFIDALYFFSLSPKHLILISEFDSLDKKYHQNKFWLNDNIVEKVNKSIVGNATRFTFSKESHASLS